MKFFVLLTALPVLCTPVAGCPLRAPCTSLVSIGQETFPVRVGFDETEIIRTPEGYVTPHVDFAPLPQTDVQPEDSLVHTFDFATRFGPEVPVEPAPAAIAAPLLAMLNVSSFLGTTEPPDLAFLVTGLAGIGMAFCAGFAIVSRAGWS